MDAVVLLSMYSVSCECILSIVIYSVTYFHLHTSKNVQQKQCVGDNIAMLRKIAISTGTAFLR